MSETMHVWSILAGSYHSTPTFDQDVENILPGWKAQTESSKGQAVIGTSTF